MRCVIRKSSLRKCRHKLKMSFLPTRLVSLQWIIDIVMPLERGFRKFINGAAERMVVVSINGVQHEMSICSGFCRQYGHEWRTERIRIEDGPHIKNHTLHNQHNNKISHGTAGAPASWEQVRMKRDMETVTGVESLTPAAASFLW